MAQRNLGEIIRNVALLGFVVFVVGPCAYKMVTQPSADEVLVTAARSSVGGDFSNGWIVISPNGNGRAVCSARGGADFVYREGATLPTWSTSGEMSEGAVRSWCAASSRVTALQPDGRL